ncbi:serine/threonine-protein kinase AFC3 isoform X2 [Lactuca sativa]|uniref:serine/threonine-protein kinase AFC3 isoform X2 n=2 Tax=Lactuca sativa TaxID=4236 RepID=UPI000CD92055|nr:serine/threonine-protein kinase AFC3 isoform X2 [Lactuca sativa]
MVPIDSSGFLMVEEKEQQHNKKRRRLTWDVAASPAEQQEAEVRQRHISPPKRKDDREGHYTYNLGENLTPRYKILSKMGEGTFGRVLECWDRETRGYVAIKVVRSIRKYRDAAMIEVDVLEQLAKNHKGRSQYVSFTFVSVLHHSWMLSSLQLFLQLCPDPELVRLPQSYMHNMHSLGLIHTDLKPENILLVSSDYLKLPGYKRTSQGETHFRCLPKSSEIKLIDFGSTAYDNQKHSSIVSTRHYRAPEVILGIGWSYPCDMWSIGCILVELFTGEALFQTHENLEHLAMMERVLGPLPEHMVQRANQGAEKYFRRSRLKWPEGAVSRESIRAVRKLDRLKNMISGCVSYGGLRSCIVDLLYGLLKFDPEERLTAEEALDHPFFRNTHA